MATKHLLNKSKLLSKSDQEMLQLKGFKSEEPEIEQYGKKVVDFSSQYGSDTSISYTTCNLAGAINIFPGYGDYTQACVFRKYGPWWNMVPSATKRYRRTPKDYFSQDFIEISFEKKVYPTKIHLYETYNPGAVVKIMACDTAAGTDVDTGKVMWKTLWSHAPVKTKLESRIFSPPLTDINFPTDLIRLELCHDLLGYYTELDAIILYGYETNPPTQSSELIEANIKNIQQLEISNEVQSPTYRYGLFESLPDEVIQLILSYLDTPSLGHAAHTCKLFHKHCYDPLLFTELNLQPHWTQISDHVLHSLHMRCQLVQRLNLSWGGKNGPLSPSAVDSFFKACGRCLSTLGLSCCQFVTEDTMETLCKHCPVLTELDLSGCRNIDNSGLMYLSKMKTLKKVNLYRSQADMPSVLGLIYGCPNLEHLNLGACTRVTSFNDVALALASNCKKLKSLDFWRARTFSDVGLNAITNSCPNLEEIDLGWCSALQSGSGCFINLAEKCCKIKKLFLTANRSVCDMDLISIANHCSVLEQLDILGTREVSVTGASRILEKCKNLKMFDISFCADIDEATVDNWQHFFPHVDLKKSFQA